MNNENLNAKEQGGKDAKHRMMTLIMWLYRHVLKFYPASFRAAFADEMTDVFVTSLRESKGHFALMSVVCREVFGLPLSLIAVHHQAHRQLPAALRRVQQVRWFVRIIAGLLGLFLLSTLRATLSPNYHLYIQTMPFAMLLFITSASLLLAIRWERVGGLLTGSGGVALGIFMTLYLTQIAASVEVSLLAGFLWMLPFVIFGVLFHQLSQQPRTLLSV